jgi:hypothetical protein
MGNRAAPFQSVGEILDRFGSTPAEARERLASWMVVEDPPPTDPLPASRPVGDGAAIDDLRARVCLELGLDPRRLESPRRGPVSDARAAVAHLGRDALGVPSRQIASALGLSVRAVERAVRRGAELVDASPVLSRLRDSLPRGRRFTSSHSRNVP